MKKRVSAILLSSILSLAMAVNASAAQGAKKGLLVQPGMYQDILELGCTHAEVNLSTAQPADGYLWFSRLCKANGISFTMILLNNFGGPDPNLLPVSEPVAGVGNYAFNSMTPEGEAAVRDYAKRLANIYGDTVTNWIIGNEVNDGEVWDYNGIADIDQHAASYAKTFRIFYEEITAVNPNARVMIPFDMKWTATFAIHPMMYGSREYLNKLNALLRDTNYGIAWHPYPQDYYAGPEFMNDSLATDDVNAQIVNLRNLHILTDYIQNADFLAPDGTVRHLILSEMGFTSACENGEARQAEAIRQAYEIANANPFVEAFILERQVDAGSQVAAGGAFGLWTRDETAPFDEQPLAKKQAWYVYQELQ